MPDNDFVWTDKALFEFVNSISSEAGKWKENEFVEEVEFFKKSKQPILDYVILKCEKNTAIHNYIPKNDNERISNCVDDGCKIHSVKRLSDNTIYTIGDIVGCILNDTIFDIKEIEISGEPYLINKKLNHYMPLRNAYKTKYPIDLNPKLIEVKLTKFELYKLMKLING